MSTIPFIKDMVTTNWDMFFEEETGAIPIVTPQDYAFWDLPERKIFKIHGSMSNIGTLVATKEDYDACYKQLGKGVIGASLKHMLATKTILFVGYSFRDEDFQKIYKFIQRELGAILPESYIVTRSSTPHGAANNSKIIHTDASYFIKKLKEELVKQQFMLPDNRFEVIDELWVEALRARQQVVEYNSFSKFPELAYTSSYLEGLIHALERIQVRKNTGECSFEHRIAHKIHSYERLLKGAIKAKKYYDASYIEGYQAGLFSLVLEDVTDVPIYYLYGYKNDINSFNELKKLLGKGNTSKLALNKANAMMKKLGNMHPVHTAFIDGVEPV